MRQQGGIMKQGADSDPTHKDDGSVAQREHHKSVGIKDGLSKHRDNCSRIWKDKINFIIHTKHKNKFQMN